MKVNSQQRICIVGSGMRFLSGISYHTLRLANAMAGMYQTSVILMRQLLPNRFYPGRKRVGRDLTDLKYSPSVQVMNGVDWFWFPSIFRAVALLIRERPNVIVFQWWSGTVLHSYLALALVARSLGAKVVIELHEILDTAEASILPVRAYVGLLFPLLRRLAKGFVVHSEYDREVFAKHFNLRGCPVVVMPPGSYDHYQAMGQGDIYREAPPECCNLLFFGVIRPYKGLEDLINAFNSIPEDEISTYWFTVVGETWEGWTLPKELITNSKYAERITFINRYVPDKEVAAFFAGADAAVLPYHRSSASGPLHTAMSYGLPVVVTRVGGLTEAVANYEGAVLVPPHDPAALQSAMKQIATLRGKRFADPHSWERNVRLYSHLFSTLAKDGRVI